MAAKTVRGKGSLQGNKATSTKTKTTTKNKKPAVKKKPISKTTKKPVKKNTKKSPVDKKSANAKGKFKKGNTVGKGTRFQEGRDKTGGRQKKTPEELRLLWDAYMVKMKKDKGPLTIQGVCKALGMSRQTFNSSYRKDPLYRDIIEKILINIEDYVTRFGFTGKATAFVIFYLKNFFGWKDDRSLRLGGMEEDEAGPVRIIMESQDIMNAVRGSSDSEENEGSCIN